LGQVEGTVDVATCALTACEGQNWRIVADAG
jgi:hypothetical protein